MSTWNHGADPRPRRRGVFWQCSDGCRFAGKRRAFEHEARVAAQRAARSERDKVARRMRADGVRAAKLTRKWSAGMKNVERAVKETGKAFTTVLSVGPAAAPGPLDELDRRVAAVCAIGRGEARRFPPLELSNRREGRMAEAATF